MSKLTTPKKKFAETLQRQLAEGKRILAELAQPILPLLVTQHERAFKFWDSYNRELLRQSFSIPNNQYVKQYSSADAWAHLSARIEGVSDIDYRRAFLNKSLSPKVDYLEEMLVKIDFIAPDAQIVAPSLDHLHPAVQQAAGSRVASNHFSDAVFATCTALDKAVQQKAQRPDLNGKPLMDVAFTPKNPVLRLSKQDNEQTGYMLLYQGVMQAIRNHYAHNDPTTDPARALEWLNFLSALFYKLDEATEAVTPPTS
jgi:uncharacterized protein (TIGR02391 family)